MAENPQVRQVDEVLTQVMQLALQSMHLKLEEFAYWPFGQVWLQLFVL
jgi:hypothetical protein